MSAMLSTGSAAQLWQGLLSQAQARVHARLPEDQESYLVFTLLRHCRDGLLPGRTMALELLDGLGQPGRLRCDRLRDVGDRCLLLAGLFPGQATRRLVGTDYFPALGRSAYGELGAVRGDPLAGLYRQLALAFDALVRVLAGLRGSPGGGSWTA
ncbi:MAG: hypothetical protein KF823_15750 [Xanthomonadales bacterium]|nr:hypothetical protein [Xanthomonadales bacterium]